MSNRPVSVIRMATLALVCATTIIVQCRAETFSYDKFESPAGLILKGAAAPFEGRLRVTPAVIGKPAGGMWRATKQSVQDGFETMFQIQITQKYCFGADGLAFIIQNTAAPEVGLGGRNLGYGGLTNVLVIKFDNYHWRGDTYVKFDEVAVLAAGSPGAMLWDNVTNTLASVTNNVVFSDGAVHTARIIYVPGNLQVYLDDLENPLMTVYVNLAKRLNLDEGRAWVGFTAGCGADWQNQDLVSWSFVSDDTLSRLKRLMTKLQSERTSPSPTGADRQSGTEENGAVSPDSSRDPRINLLAGAFAQMDAASNRTNLVRISAYENKARTVTEVSVAGNGLEHHARIGEGVVEGRAFRRLSDTELNNLRAALAALPATTDSTPLDHVTIVSFREGANWVTRAYDTANPPEPLSRIYGIIWNSGERAK